jgi:hypothetical protein
MEAAVVTAAAVTSVAAVTLAAVISEVGISAAVTVSVMLILAEATVSAARILAAGTMEAGGSPDTTHFPGEVFTAVAGSPCTMVRTSATSAMPG